MKKSERYATFLLLCGALGCASSQSSPQLQSAGIKPPAAFNPREIEAGREIHAQLISTFYTYTEPRFVEYLNRVGREVARRGRPLPYDFTILVSDKIYAISAPGGHVYITTGFLNFLESEAELAGVLAHEIGQLQYKNPELSGTKKMLDSLEAGSAIASGFFGEIGTLTFLGIKVMNSIAAPQKTLESRVQTADRLTLGYMASAGFDPQAWLDLLAKIVQSKERSVYQIFDYYNSRPITVDRIKRLEQVFEKMDLNGKTLATRRESFLEASKGIREIYRPVP